MDRRGFLSGAIAGASAFASTSSEQSRGDLKHAQFAIVEINGYRRLVGRLSQGISGLLQLDIPVEGGMVTQMINPASVYRITFVDEHTVRGLARSIDPLPSLELEAVPVQQRICYEDEEGEF